MNVKLVLIKVMKIQAGRQADRQTDRQTDNRQADRQTDRQTDRQQSYKDLRMRKFSQKTLTFVPTTLSDTKANVSMSLAKKIFWETFPCFCTTLKPQPNRMLSISLQTKVVPQQHESARDNADWYYG